MEATRIPRKIHNKLPLKKESSRRKETREIDPKKVGFMWLSQQPKTKELLTGGKMWCLHHQSARSYGRFATRDFCIQQLNTITRRLDDNNSRRLPEELQLASHRIFASNKQLKTITRRQMTTTQEGQKNCNLYRIITHIHHSSARYNHQPQEGSPHQEDIQDATNPANLQNDLEPYFPPGSFVVLYIAQMYIRTTRCSPEREPKKISPVHNVNCQPPAAAYGPF